MFGASSSLCCMLHTKALLVKLRQPVWCDLSQLGLRKVGLVVRKPRQLGAFACLCYKLKLRSLENRKHREAIRRS